VCDQSICFSLLAFSAGGRLIKSFKTLVKADPGKPADNNLRACITRRAARPRVQILLNPELFLKGLFWEVH
jgi:hypothetical protein